MIRLESNKIYESNKKNYESNKKFSFPQVTEEHVRQVILSIDGSKATPVGDIPADMLKVTLDIHLSLITKIINLLLSRRFKTCRSYSYFQEKQRSR